MANNTVCLWSIEIPGKTSDEENTYPDPIWCTCLSEAEKTFKSRIGELQKHRVAMMKIKHLEPEEYQAERERIDDEYGGDWACYRCVMRIHVLRTTKAGLLDALKYRGMRNSKIVKEYNDGNVTLH
jgi:hypothetical protein